MKKHRILSLLLALILCMSSAVPAAAETASGSVLQLTKTEGTVKVTKNSGKSVKLRSNLRLYKGYRVNTSEKSYAWINLDDAKLIKEDASSEVEVRKSGKKLEVNVSAGNVFFDVSEKLDDDESLNISTSTMVVGIRGTSGWVEIANRWQSRLYVLEGTTRCFVSDPVTGQTKSAEVHGGEMVECVVYPQDREGDKCDILTKQYEVGDIPGNVLVDLVRDVPLCDKILQETGMDIPRALAQKGGGRPDGRTGNTATREVIREAEKRLHQDEKQTGIKLNDINEKLEKQDNHVSTDAVWEENKPTPPDPNKGTGGGGGSGRPTTPDRPTPPVTKTYTVTFSLDGEGAAWPDGTTGPITLSTGANGRLTSRPPTPVRAGYEFGGWYVASRARAGETPIDLNTYVFSSDTRLRAIWTQKEIPPETFTVTFNANGGTVSPSTAQTAADGTVALPTPTRDGFTFDGWFTSATGGTAVTAATKFTQNTTVYAHWTRLPPETFTVTLDPNDGIASPTTATTDKNGRITLPTPVHSNPLVNTYTSGDTTVKDYYVFDGWYTEATGGKKVEASKVYYWNTTVYAHWVRELNVSGNGAMADYSSNNDRPWDADMGSISKVTIENGVTSIGRNAFYYCNLTSMDIPNSVTSIGDGAFGYCNDMTSITIPNSVTRIGGYAFYYCYALTSITIPDSVTSIGYGAFHMCSGLTSVTIPDSVTSIEADAFYGCSGLTGITIPNSVTSIEDSTFDGCTSLTGVTIPDSVTSIGRQAFGRCSGLTSITIPNRVTSIGYRAFWGCSSLTSITISNSVTEIDQYVFDGCTSLSSVTIPNSVTSIAPSAFSNCGGLTSITIPNSVTSIGYTAFLNCSGLTSVTIPNSVTIIGAGAFGGCNSLTNINVDTTNSNYSSVDGTLLNKDQTELICCPEGKAGAYTIPNGVTNIKGHAFNSCESLTSVTIPSSVTSIDYDAFENCTSLTSITIPNSVTFIGHYVFSGCSSLTSVTISNSVTYIAQATFKGCTSLTSVTIPNSVTSIDQATFEGCTSLTDVYYLGTQAQWNAIKISSYGNDPLTKATIHCTDGDITPTP